MNKVQHDFLLDKLNEQSLNEPSSSLIHPYLQRHLLQLLPFLLELERSGL